VRVTAYSANYFMHKDNMVVDQILFIHFQSFILFHILILLTPLFCARILFNNLFGAHIFISNIFDLFHNHFHSQHFCFVSDSVISCLSSQRLWTTQMKEAPPMPAAQTCQTGEDPSSKIK